MGGVYVYVRPVLKFMPGCRDSLHPGVKNLDTVKNLDVKNLDTWN